MKSPKYYINSTNELMLLLVVFFKYYAIIFKKPTGNADSHLNANKLYFAVMSNSFGYFATVFK